MEFKIASTRFSFSFGFFVVLCLYCLYDREGAGIPVLCAVALHEGGHVLALKAVKGKIPYLRFEPFGIRMVRSGLLTYGQEFLVYSGGILANAIVLLITLPLFGWCHFTIANLALLLFHSLPVGRLDGGQLLRTALSHRMNNLNHVETVQRLVGFLILTPLFAGGFYLLPQKNITLLLTACYLALTLWKS